jgi:hypothetical protein
VGNTKISTHADVFRSSHLTPPMNKFYANATNIPGVPADSQPCEAYMGKIQRSCVIRKHQFKSKMLGSGLMKWLLQDGVEGDKLPIRMFPTDISSDIYMQADQAIFEDQYRIR